jgi:hypothetical protein
MLFTVKLVFAHVWKIGNKWPNLNKFCPNWLFCSIAIILSYIFAFGVCLLHQGGLHSQTIGVLFALMVIFVHDRN